MLRGWVGLFGSRVHHLTLKPVLEAVRKDHGWDDAAQWKQQKKEVRGERPSFHCMIRGIFHSPCLSPAAFFVACQVKSFVAEVVAELMRKEASSSVSKRDRAESESEEDGAFSSDGSPEPMSKKPRKGGKHPQADEAPPSRDELRLRSLRKLQRAAGIRCVPLNHPARRAVCLTDILTVVGMNRFLVLVVSSPNVYRGIPEMSTETAVETLAARLREHGCTFKGAAPTQAEIKEAERQRNLARELEGIDTSNIIRTSGRPRRRRAGAASAHVEDDDDEELVSPPRKPKAHRRREQEKDDPSSESEAEWTDG